MCLQRVHSPVYTFMQLIQCVCMCAWECVEFSLIRRCRMKIIAFVLVLIASWIRSIMCVGFVAVFCNCIKTSMYRSSYRVNDDEGVAQQWMTKYTLKRCLCSCTALSWLTTTESQKKDEERKKIENHINKTSSNRNDMAGNKRYININRNGYDRTLPKNYCVA